MLLPVMAMRGRRFWPDGGTMVVPSVGLAAGREAAVLGAPLVPPALLLVLPLMLAVSRGGGGGGGTRGMR